MQNFLLRLFFTKESNSQILPPFARQHFLSPTWKGQRAKLAGTQEDANVSAASTQHQVGMDATSSVLF